VNMAHSYQDLVGQVDVISSSKNIKALLKMPYSPSPQISIMVHKLCNTLLLEEFDVYKHLIRKQAEESSWLSSYFYEVIAKEDQEKHFKFLDGSPASRDSFVNNMYMNLIRHSFAASGSEDLCAVVPAPGDDAQHVDAFRDSSEDLKGFHHETLWKFQDISMLIDSDLPIFGGGSARRPCISLRLRDSRSPPINILTGLDYWLDNLMSNVPEVAMCYHINGFVQKYEVIKTEDIPNLENSNFDPNEVLDIARNIMSFIKCNAAVEGHTYWLYKSENDEMVKLYDLTNLCKDKIVTGENPFTVPVGLLCHRVARNLKFSGQRRNADSRAMFENCIRLLDDSKYCQECADSHFHLSDMWVPDKSINDLWQEKGKISDPPVDLYDEHDTDSDDGPQGEEKSSTPCPESAENECTIRSKSSCESPQDKEAKSCVALKELVVRGMVKKRAWQTVQANRIAGTTDQRCREALSHIRKGLNIIDRDLAREKSENDIEGQQQKSPTNVIPLPYVPLNISTKDNYKKTGSSQKMEGEPKMCKPWEAIPLPCKMKSEGKESEASKSTDRETATASNTKSSTNWETKAAPVEECAYSTNTINESSLKKSWYSRAKFQLLRKAAIAYYVLAKEFCEINKYGHTLRHLRYAMHCYEALELLNSDHRSFNHSSPDSELYMMLLYLAAQARAFMRNNLSGEQQDFDELGEEEAAILHSAQAVLATPKMSWIYEWSPNAQANLLTAVELYEKILKLPAIEKRPKSFQATMKKEYAGCLMNLGIVQLDICKEKILNKAKEKLEKAVKIFDAVGERNAAAHNCCNVAYAYNLAAAAIHNYNQDGVILPPKEKEYLLKFIEWTEKCARHYERGEKMDKSREIAYQSIRMQYQQMANQYFFKSEENVTEDEIESIREYLQKSLKYCFLDSQGPFLRSSRSIAASNNIKLAKTYEVEFNRCKNPVRKKHLRQKISEHLQKSLDLYKQLDWPKSLISTTFVWASTLLKDACTDSATVAVKRKPLRNVLSLMCDIRPAVEAVYLGEEGDEECPNPLFKTNKEVLETILAFINNSFSSILRIDKSNKVVKDLYKRSLRITTVKDLHQVYLQLIQFLEELKTALESDCI
ncbi:erythroid differentiation-related factor 1-like, partial [Plakobranchus ocellatus]